MAQSAAVAGNDVIFEQRRMGPWLRVTAVCPRTGEEATSIGPAEAPEAVRRIAAQKLVKRLGASGV